MRVAGRRGRVVIVGVPVPAPFLHVAGHVVEPVAVGAETPGRRGVGLAAGRVGLVVALGRREVVVVETDLRGEDNAVVVPPITEVIREREPDRVHPPREAPAGQPAAGRLLPFRLGRQAVAVGTPVAGRREAAGAAHRPAHRVAGLQPLKLAARVAPLHRRMPVDVLHRMVGRLAAADRQVGVAVGRPPVPHQVPLRLGHLGLADEERAQRDGVRRRIRQAIHRIPHREGARRDQDKARGRGFTREDPEEPAAFPGELVLHEPAGAVLGEPRRTGPIDQIVGSEQVVAEAGVGQPDQSAGVAPGKHDLPRRRPGGGTQGERSGHGRLQEKGPFHGNAPVRRSGIAPPMGPFYRIAGPLSRVIRPGEKDRAASGTGPGPPPVEVEIATTSFTALTKGKSAKIL